MYEISRQREEDGTGPIMTATENNERASLRVSSLDAIVAAALPILDREGLNALSMRRLAAVLELGPMTLYTYVASKEVLLDHVTARVLGDIADAVPAGADWRARLLALMEALRQRLRAHPWVTDLFLARSGPVTALDGLREAMLAALSAGGLDIERSVDASTALVAYVTGYRIVERTRTEADVVAERARLAGLDADRFHFLASTAGLYRERVSPNAFRIGLTSLIDGLAGP